MLRRGFLWYFVVVVMMGLGLFWFIYLLVARGFLLLLFGWFLIGWVFFKHSWVNTQSQLQITYQLEQCCALLPQGLEGSGAVGDSLPKLQ